MLWVDERKLPTELELLIDDSATPKDLWKEIVLARDEIINHGAVTYPTKARIESMIIKLSLENKDE